MKSEWKTVRLGDVADVQSGPFGSQLHESDYVSQGGTPIVTVEHLGSKYFTRQNLPLVSAEDKLRLSRYVTTYGDVIFSRVGSVDRCSFVGHETDGWMFSGRCIRVRTKSSVDGEFLYYFLSSQKIKQLVRDMAVGTTMPSINSMIMGDVPIEYPPLPTQRKIAAVLGAIDDKIENNRKICANLEAQAQALFKSWFVDFEPFGGKMPKGWKIVSIYESAEIIYGAPFKSKLFNETGDGRPIIRIRDLKNNATKTFTTEQHEKEYVVQAGDLIVGMDGEFRPYIWGNKPALLNQRVCVFKPKGTISVSYLIFAIKPQLEFVESTEAATTVIHIGKEDFDAFKICVPEVIWLERFNSVAQKQIELCTILRRQNVALAEMRDALLPKLMSGEIDVEKVKVA